MRSSLAACCLLPALLSLHAAASPVLAAIGLTYSGSATPANTESRKYLLTRPLSLVTRGPPKGDVKTFVDFMLSPAGQEIVSRNFVPVPPRKGAR